MPVEEEGCNHLPSTEPWLVSAPSALPPRCQTFQWSIIFENSRAHAVSALVCSASQMQRIQHITADPSVHLQQVWSVQDTWSPAQTSTARVQQLLRTPAAPVSIRNAGGYGSYYIQHLLPLGLRGTNQEISKDLLVVPLLSQPLLMQAELGWALGWALGLALKVLPGSQLSSVRLAFVFWIQHSLSIVSCRSTDCIRGSVDFCIDYTESKRKSA